MKHTKPFIIIFTLLAIASCSIEGPLYHEVLMPPIADGTWITYQGIGNSRTMLILTVDDSNLSLAIHGKDPFTGDFSTEPFATYSGYAEDIRTLSEDISYSWYRTYHRMRLKDVLSIIRKEGKALNYSEASIRETSENAEKAAKLQETFGYPSWFDWAKAWWNTKWDVAELRITDDIEGLLSITFHTAWSFPETPMIVLSRLSPGTQMTFRYADEDIAYGRCGSMVVKGGLVIDRHIGIDKNECAKVWGYRDYTDYESQMEA